jgi:hypothetical protein
MSAVKSSLRLLTQYVEWRASRIEDPLERLKYLQRSAVWNARGAGRVRDFRWRAAAIAALLVWALLPARTRTAQPVPTPAAPRPRAASTASEPAVWLVEHKPGYELYSNGLRIDTASTVTNYPRTEYPVFSASGGETPKEWRSEPAGIVFHSTESHQAPFEPSQTRTLARLARNVVQYVRQERAYHYVIDRFGRVFRVVAETDIANHAGNSIWGDERGVYINLNRSFLSIALEAQTDAPEAVSPAQIHAAHVLTDMLRSKYGIRAENCVTHAQVSVSPASMLIGYHTDWAGGFPFEAIGLPNNYELPAPSIAAFGFGYDEALLKASGERPWAGLVKAEQGLVQSSAAQGLSPGAYRRRLQHRFRRILNSAAARAHEEKQS